MKKTTKILMLLLIVSLLLLGIGYAAIQNITLNISGTATSDPSQSNFKVKFSGTPEVSDSVYVTIGMTNETNATMNVSGLTQKGQTASATFEIENASSDLSADVSVITTNSNTEYFTLSSKLTKTSLEAGEKTTVKVTTELNKTPISDSVSSNIGIQLTVTPVQPGEEGTSGITNKYSQTPGDTLSVVTNVNIGDYIDLGNNIIKTESTTDDWRILYKDEEYVHVILAEWLPNSTGHAKAAGLDTTDETTGKEYEIDVFVKDGESTVLLNGLMHSTAWNSLANGIEGASVIGTPTAELLMNSYNTTNGTSLDYTQKPILAIKTDKEDLYGRCRGGDHAGYWLATYFDSNALYIVTEELGPYEIGSLYVGFSCAGIRPVVSLPLSTKCIYDDGIWTVIK